MRESQLHNLPATSGLLAIMALLLVTGGCSLTRSQTVWRQTSFAVPDAVGLNNWSLAAAEELYATAVRLESCGCADCVDHYYQTASYVWPVLERELKVGGTSTPRTSELYRSSVAKLLITAQKFGCWDPAGGLVISSASGQTILPTSFQGFVWGPEEFQFLEPAGDYKTPNLSRAFRTVGLGVPLVVVRNTNTPQPFTQKLQPFAATVVLRPNPSSACHQLDFYDPLRVSSTEVGGCPVPLARDLTAPFAFASQGEDREWLDNFLQPGATGTGDGLFMIEPYQPGRIPVVFIHGLLSDPATWANLVNELRAHPEMNDHYQWWAFEYATGEPFLTSAAVLRRQLVQIRNLYDLARSDPALSQMVLIGHSMGGLVAKLQVTESGDRLWSAVARRPLANVHTNEATRQELSKAFYFRPSFDVARVVYLGTPHLGSAWARRAVGRLGSALVEPSPDSDRRHSQLVHDNPDLFQDELQDRFPTSVDLLEPESPLLAATASLPYSPGVTLHSIIGQGKTTWKGEPSDGVVPVASARLLGVASESLVEAKHEALHSSPAAVAEVLCLLREHLRYQARFSTAHSHGKVAREARTGCHVPVIDRRPTKKRPPAESRRSESSG